MAALRVPRQAEVEDLYPAVLGEHDVFRLQVAVDDSGGVGGGEAVGNLRRDVEQLAGRNGLAGEQGTERFALDEFADDVLLAGLDAKVVDGDDVGVVERGDGAGLALEAAAVIGAGGACPREDLDGDVAIEPGVAGAVDLAHAADPESGLDLVVAEAEIGGSGIRSKRGLHKWDCPSSKRENCRVSPDECRLLPVSLVDTHCAYKTILAGWNRRMQRQSGYRRSVGVIRPTRSSI